MTSDDWYRNNEWNEEIEKIFYSKLKRARSQRDQYLVIQALTLAEKFPNITLRLVDEYFESRKNRFDDVRALLAKTKAYLSLSDIDNAIKAYYEIFAVEAEFPNHQTGAYLDYPYLVATQKIEPEYANAKKILNANIGRLTFPLDYFKWHASQALIDSDRIHALKALDAANVKKSGFQHHQEVGLVGHDHKDTIELLLKISST